jgi:conjugative transposon TraN protein
MKKIMMIVVTDAMLVFGGAAVHAQQPGNMPVKVIRPYPLAIACLKTTNLVFPYAIRSVDRGSDAVLARKATGVDNVLQVKAAKADFQPTNLTVITADGQLYSYLLHYARDPGRLNLVFGKTKEPGTDGADSVDGAADFDKGTYNLCTLRQAASRAAADKRSVFGKADRSYGMAIKLEGVYAGGNVLYYRILLHNSSNIDYGIGGFRFAVMDRRRYKRTAAQEIDIRPVYIFQDTTVIRGHTTRLLVFALPKLTFPDNKYLSIRLAEKDGGRNLELKVPARTIMRTRPVRTP